MAVTHWYLGRASETTATVIVRADSTGDVSVICNGVTKQAACNTGVNDGNAIVEFTGLQPGTRYSYTVGGAEGGSLRTFPSSGTFWVAFSSCWAIAKVDTLARMLLRAPASGAMRSLHQELVEKLCAVISLGDFTYMNSNTTINGVALSLVDGGTLANAKDIAIRRAYYRSAFLTPGRLDAMRSLPWYLMWDDHEKDPDNACYSTAWLARQYGGNPTSQDLTDVWTAASTAWREWALGNPPKIITSGVLGGPEYYRLRIGPLELWVTDLIHERDDIAAADGPSKRMMSALQEQDMLDSMAESDATWKCWASTKQFISTAGRNADGWYNLPGATSEGYQTQLQRILADARFPTRGAFSITGDEHVKGLVMVDANRFGGTHAAISQMSGGPASIDVITDPDDGSSYRDGVRYKERDTSNLSRRGENNYGLLRVMPEEGRIERWMLGSRNGLQYHGYIGTTDNIPRF